MWRFLHFGWALLLVLVTAAGGATASEVSTLEARIDAQSAAVKDAQAALAAAEQAAAGRKEALAALVATEGSLAERRAAALAALKAQFEAVVAEPSTPLEAELKAYRDAAAAEARQRAELAAGEAALAAAQAQVADLRAEAAKAAEAVAQLRSGLDRARAQRLLREIGSVGRIEVRNTVSCAPEETIAGCITRAEDAARQLARQRYAEQLFAGVTDAQTVAKHRVTAGVEPRLVESAVTDSGFRGQGDYVVALDARLRAEATLADACALLGLSDAACMGKLPTSAGAVAAAVPASAAALPPTPATAPPEPPEREPEPEPEPEPITADAEAPPEPAPAPVAAAADAERFRLTVRSNVYYDEVYIDGVPYGSTKLDVMLPRGAYDVEVRKPGHSPFRQRIELTGSRTLRAQLAELGEP
jgi:hypothetical protein